MKVYGTIDENGVDGFGFNERDKNIRMLRAKLNEWRGMSYFEIEVSETEKNKMAKLAEKNEWKRLARFVRKKINKERIV